MKSKLLYLLVIHLFCLIQGTKAHELNFGIFELYELQSSYYIDIRLDKANILRAIQVDHSVASVQSIHCEIIQYLDSNFWLEFNDQNTTLEYIDFSMTEEVLLVTARAQVPIQNIVQIKVNNTVLIDDIENQVNIIRASFHKKNRSFRLTDDRISTIIEY